MIPPIKKNQKGFTLVELLVVIGILGILAAGLLAAIDPLEQLKKGQDQNKRNIATEYLNALTRYYATYSKFPWTTGTNHALTTATLSNTAATTTTLVTSGELKANFVAAAGATTLDALSLTSNASGEVTVCFNPDSKSISLDPNTLFTSVSGTTGASCPSTSDITACFYCAQ